MFVVAATAERRSVAERNLRRALDDARETAGVDATADRVAWHLLRHSFAPMLATDLEPPSDRARPSDGSRGSRVTRSGSACMMHAIIRSSKTSSLRRLGAGIR
jgi:hypothetical protein